MLVVNTMSQKLKRKAEDQDGQAQAKKPRGGPDLTEFAELYTHPPWFLNDPEDSLSYLDPLKSGISPLEQGPFSTEAERNQYIVLDEYQKRMFKRKFESPTEKFRPNLMSSQRRFHGRRAAKSQMLRTDIEANRKRRPRKCSASSRD
jgi:hypothetical protein